MGKSAEAVLLAPTLSRVTACDQFFEGVVAPPPAPLHDVF
jgi:hypothetical protein